MRASSRQEGADAPQEGQTVARPARPIDDGALRGVMLDLLGRPPLAAEREHWLGRRYGGLVESLVGSAEFWSHWLEEQLYYFLLVDNFRPETPRVLAIPGDLERGAIHVRDAIHRIALCSSFDARNPGADTFVTVVMEQLDGLKVQSNVRELDIGKRVYDGHSGLFLGETGRSQADVVRIAVEHKRFGRTLAAREYGRLVRAEPSASELADWGRRLHKDPDAYPRLVNEWLQSPAYAERLERRAVLPNRMFVRALFVDLLGRLPDEDEARRMRTALDGLSDPGPLRSVLARLLIDSGQARLPEKQAIEDPSAWVADLFRRLLGRPAGEDELRTFVSAFHEPACRPSTLLYALVSHPEYHRY
jgi:hypothetical protein